jgi:hypothetical protein
MNIIRILLVLTLIFVLIGFSYFIYKQFRSKNVSAGPLVDNDDEHDSYSIPRVVHDDEEVEDDESICEPTCGAHGICTKRTGGGGSFCACGFGYSGSTCNDVDINAKVVPKSDKTAKYDEIFIQAAKSVGISPESMEDSNRRCCQRGMESCCSFLRFHGITP